ncbi:cupredoxin domain-containing protein [bacterium]|nr:cupredoxin domain-containing protein [bacterium]
MKFSSYYTILTIVIVLFLTSSCEFNNNDDPADSNLIRIRDNSFDPPVLSVVVGRVVAWRHEGSSPHTVTSGSPTQNPGGRFDSGTLRNGQGFTFTFSEAGIYPYFCKVHGAMMSGTIQVR